MTDGQSNLQQPSFWSFWTTLPGIITAIAGLITAIAGLIGALYVAGIIGKPPDSSGEVAAIKKYVESQTEDTPKCYTFGANSFEFIPYSLHYTLKDSIKAKDFMYWFHFNGKNKCSDRLEIIITFKSLRKQPLVQSEYIDENPHRYAIDPGDSFDRKPHPGFKFPKEDVDDTLEVRWEILRASDKKRLEYDKSEIRVLSKNKFIWNLRAPNGGRVSEDFLLASLAAWTQSSSSVVPERSKRLLQGVDLRSHAEIFANQFVSRSYKELFGGESPEVVLIHSGKPFPPKGGTASTRHVQTPSQVLKSGEADPLEAALLVGALSQEQLVEKRGIHPVLFTMPDREGRPNVLLAWHVGFLNWQAIDMTRIGAMSFENNLHSATVQVKRLLTQQSDIITGLKDDGVFVRKGNAIIAVDFAKAADEFGIKPLP